MEAVGTRVIGIIVILGRGNFSAIFRIRGLSKGEFWDDFLFEVCVLLLNSEKISMLAPAIVIITITAIKISIIFNKFRLLGGLIVSDIGWETGCASRG